MNSRSASAWKYCLVVILHLVAVTGATAQTPPPVTAGLSFLSSHQNANGTWGTTPELTARDTARVLIVEKLLRTDNANTAAGLAWLGSQGLDANQFLAEQALALSRQGINAAPALIKLAQQRSASAPDFGGFVDHNGDTLDSALAVQALAAQEQTWATTISGVVSMLISRQNADGGWGIDQGFDSNPVLTSEVLVALTSLKNLQAPPVVIAAGQGYLARLIHPDGSIGSGPLETACAFRALALSGYSLSSTSAATFAYLSSLQGSDGSWGTGNAYVTARVLEAYAANKPNLVVKAADYTLNPHKTTEGSNVTATIIVRNIGATTSPATTLELHTDDINGRNLGTASVGSIAAGASQTISVNFTATQLSGTVQVFAIVDPTSAIDEMRKDDNSATQPLVVDGKPDLQIFSSDIATNPPRLQPNQSGQLTITIHNNGESDVAAAGYAVYEAAGSAAETLLKKGTTGAIVAGAAQIVSVNVSLAAGTHTLRVVADPDSLINESNEGNNQATKTISVNATSNVDLRIRPGNLVATPNRPTSGQAVVITAIVENAGTDPVKSTVAFYDGVPGFGATVIAVQSVTIDAQSSTQLQVNYVVNDNSRVIYAVADPDNLLTEIDESNNTAFAALTDQIPDLSVSRDGFVLPKASLSNGQTLNARLVVKNIGIAPATNVEVVIYDDLPQNGGNKIVDKFIDVPASGKVVVSASWPVRAGQRFATAVVNPAHTVSEVDFTNNRVTKLYTATGGEGDIALNTSIARTDAIDRSGLNVDPNDLTISGILKLNIYAPVSKAFTVTLFEDLDGDLAFNPEVDNAVGATLVQPGIDPQLIQIAAQGTVHFAPGHLLVYLDSSNAVAETREDNNIIDIYQDCQTTAKSFAPGVKWSTGDKTFTLSPVARLIDTNDDGVIDENDMPIVVNPSSGGIVVRRGDSGQVLWGQGLTATSRMISPVIADLDGDGKPEIIAHEQEHRLVAFNADGTKKWESAELDRDPNWDFYLAIGGGFIDYSYGGAPVVADLDGDGKPEVISGRTVLNGLDGTVKWVGTGGSGRAWDTSSDHLYFENFPDQEAPIAVDLDNDGKLEVVAGNTAYRANGTILWQRGDLSDGYASPVYFTGQNTPKICLVGQGRVTMLNSDGTTLWGPVAIPGGAMLGGAPTVFMDGNSGPWVGVAGDGYYSLLDAATGNVRWTKQTTSDLSFGITTTNSATAFDFGTGMTLVYASRDKLVMMRASDGAFIYQEPISNNPFYPMSPVVADINNDGHADVIVPHRFGSHVISDPTWNGAPAIFNEAAYHVVNVSSESAAIPLRETQTAYSRVHYRTNASFPANTAQPMTNLTASYLRVDTNGYPQFARLYVRVGNNGWTGSPAAKVTFYRLNANGTSTPLGTVLSDPLNTGQYEDVAFTLSSPTSGIYTFYAVVDDDGTGTSAINECNEGDNRSANVSVRFSADLALNLASLFVTDASPRPGDSIDFYASANVSGSLDTSAVTAQFYLGNPATGGTPISPLMPVQVVSIRGQRQANVTFTWTVAAPSGPQSVFVVYDPNNVIVEDDETNNRGAYALQVSTPEAIQKLSGTITLTPPAAEPSTPVAIQMLVQNIGNVKLGNVVLNFAVTSDAGAGSGFTGTATIASILKNSYATVDFGTFTPLANSTYTVTVTPADPAVTLLVSPKSVKVAPFAGATLTAVPLRVPISVPMVQVHTKITRGNTIVIPDDPIIPLIKAHIQAGLNWQAPVLSGAMGANCYKCHVQSQGMVGFEASRQVSGITVDPNVEQAMFDSTVTSQSADGHFGVSGYPRTTTILGAWSLSYWHDAVQAQPYLLKALEGTLRYQNGDGSFDCDHCDISYGNREAMTMMAMIELARGYELTRDARYSAALTRAVNWALAYDYSSARTRGPEFAARVSIGLAVALPQITDSGLSDAMKNRIQTIAGFLKSLQNPDGSFGTLTSPDYPITRNAQCLYALALSGVQGTDPQLRAAILWLLNNQQQNGGWREFGWENNQVQWLDESTWAMIALPAAFARLGQFDVDLNILLPDSSDLSDASPPPNSSNAVTGGKQLLWRLPDVTEAGYDIQFNVKLNGLRNDEVRPATGPASLKYTNPYSGEKITRNIGVPSITGYAPLTLAITTDKQIYPPNSPVQITETIGNAGTSISGITNDVSIRDANGTKVATVIANDPVIGLPSSPFPGWHYAFPVSSNVTRDGVNRSLVFDVDFRAQIASLGLTGTFDRNSIRVSVDSAASDELYFSFFPNEANPASGKLIVVIPDSIGSGSTFAGHVFFDIGENGFKPASLFEQRSSGGGGNGLIANYWRLDTSRTNPYADPPALVYSGSPVLTTVQPTSAIWYNAPAGVPYEYWGTEWTGALFVPASGAYAFNMGSDDGSWLYIDRQIVLSLPGLHGTYENNTTVQLTAGFHAIKMVMFNWCCGYSMYVRWAPPGKGLDVIPQTNLFQTLPASDASTTIGAAQLLSDGHLTRGFTWNTGTTASGPYVAFGSLAQFATQITTAQSAFSITPASQINAALATDKPIYDNGETVHATGSAQYASGNTPLSNLTATMSILNAAGTVMTSGATPIATLNPGQNAPARLDWPLGSSPAGTYNAKLAVTDASGAKLAETTVPFDVRPTAQSGKGVTGAISTPATLTQGESLPISVTLNNTGNSALTNAPFAVKLVDPQQNLVATLPLTASIAIGATYTTQLSYGTAQLAPQTYTAYLISLITGQPVLLASSPFEVKVPPLKLDLSQAGPARVLIWNDCSPGNSGHACTPVAPPFLTKTLTDAGIPWQVVGDEFTFIKEMRTGTWSEAIIETSPNESKIAAEYLETIRNGFGLLYIQSDPNADPKLAPALGTSFGGKLKAASTTVDLLTSPFTSPGQITFNGDSVKIDVAGATAAAKVTATQAPAMTYNTYGNGHVVVLPFDVEQTPTTEVAKLILGIVGYVNRIPTGDARQVVPIDFLVTTPPGGNVSLTITATLPDGMSVVSASPALSSSNAPTWNISAAGGSKVHLYLWVRMPEAVGTYIITGTAAFAGQLAIVTKTINVTVTADRAAIESALSADLNALSSSLVKDQKAISDAQALLATARNDTSAAAAIDHVLSLINDLQSVSVDTAAARRDADRLLLYWQGKA